MGILDQFSLKGKTAVVTGASRGLGQAMAVALAEAGATVICSSSTENGCSTTLGLIHEFGGTAFQVSADLTNRDSITEFVSEVKKMTSEVNILVNNAGTITRHPAVEYPITEWDIVMQVNLHAAFQLCQEFGKDMIARGSGKIINTASLLSFSGGITVPAYTSSKHGIAGLTKALANEWAKDGVQVNAIAPGYFKTDNTQALQDNPQRNEQITARIPSSAWGEPKDLAGAVVFLASSASNYVNGHILTVDGGWMAR
jgi:2-deoxy-D-gluconate 3-dehydrogenase